MHSIYSAPGLRNSEGWALSKSNWHEGWLKRFPIRLQAALSTISEDNVADKWLDRVFHTWAGKVYYPHLNEVRKGIAIPNQATACADIKLGNRYMLLIDRELSKIEILQREILFKKLIWIVKYQNNNPDPLELLVNNFDVEKYKHSFSEHRLHELMSFPIWDEYVRRFKYNASTLFLDTGKHLYFRKYALIGSQHKAQDGYPTYLPYLKKVSYVEFMNWATQNI